MDDQQYLKEIGHSHRYVFFLIVGVLFILLFLILVVSYAIRLQSVYS